MDHYAACMNGQILGKERYGDSPMGGEGNANKLMHCVLKIGDTIIMAADNCSNEHSTTVGDNISLALGLDSVENTETIFGKMSDGGTITMPLQETYWAARFGMLKDKFGINWMFNCEKPHGSMADEK